MPVDRENRCAEATVLVSNKSCSECAWRWDLARVDRVVESCSEPNRRHRSSADTWWWWEELRWASRVDSVDDGDHLDCCSSSLRSEEWLPSSDRRTAYQCSSLPAERTMNNEEETSLRGSDRLTCSSWRSLFVNEVVFKFALDWFHSKVLPNGRLSILMATVWPISENACS